MRQGCDDLVRRHDERALDLYLLLRAAASAHPWDVKRDARIWGRAIGLASDADGGRAAVSKTWARLESTYHLVRRERLSADTVDRGLRELRRAGLLSRSFTEVENWLSPTGKTSQYKFALQPPFARAARKPAARGHLRAVGT